MEKAFFYDNVEGELHRCMFVGVDKEGKPIWLRICQGDVVMELREYEELFAKEELLLLCMEGEKVESATLAAFLGARLQSYAWNIRSNLIIGLEKLKRWNVSWHHDNLELSVIVTKYYEDLKSKDCYMFELTNEQGGSICMMDAFETMDQLMDTVRQYFAVVEFSANIPILIRRLVCSDDLLAEISEEDREMFDN